MIKVKPILPKSLGIFNPAAHQRAITRTMDLAEAAARAEIANLTREWSTPPEVHVQQRGDVRLIAIVDPRWLWADEGTKAHVIVPKRRKVLHFTTSAGEEVFTRRVNHPGTKAQHYTKKVQKRVDALNLAQTFSNLVERLR